MAQLLRGGLDGIAAENGVLAHEGKFLVGQGTGLEQDIVAHAHLADIMQRSGLVEQIDGVGGEEIPVGGMGVEVAGQEPHIVLGPLDVPAGFRIAVFGQTGHGFDKGFLGAGQFPGTRRDLGFEQFILSRQGQPRQTQGKMRLDTGLYFGDLEGFGDVIHGTEAKSFGFALGFRHGREKNHGNAFRGRVGLEPAADFIAVHAGHHDVE